MIKFTECKKNYRCLFAFTLAEVLITLGIIGVVAALTMSTLIQNMQRQAWTAQLKKSYSVLNQGFQKMLAGDGVNLLSQTSVFNSIVTHTGPDYYCNTVNTAANSTFLENFGKYFKIAEIKKFENSDNYKFYYLSGNAASGSYPNYDAPYDKYSIILTDGTMIINYYFVTPAQGYKTGIMKGFVGNFYIDVNGIKGPNKFGRDIFMFYVGENGLVYPYGSHTCSETASYQGVYPGNPDINYWRNNGGCENNGSSIGDSCAARVLELGKMDY